MNEVEPQRRIPGLYAVSPVGFAMVLIGAGVAVIGTFLPKAETTALSLGGIEQNTLIQAGGGWAIIIGGVILALVAYRAWSTGQRSWAILLISAYLIGQAFYQGSGSRLALYRIDQYGNPGQQVDASPGIGIYAVGVGGFLGLLGGWVIRQSSVLLTHEEDDEEYAVVPDDEPMKRCPDCAEVVLAAARICKHCRHEFATGQVASRRVPPAGAVRHGSCPKEAGSYDLQVAPRKLAMVLRMRWADRRSPCSHQTMMPVRQYDQYAAALWAPEL